MNRNAKQYYYSALCESYHWAENQELDFLPKSHVQKLAVLLTNWQQAIRFSPTGIPWKDLPNTEIREWAGQRVHVRYFAQKVGIHV
jgi:hypothetical protein